uniref:TSA: Wollemia nobilis Ref_Wollemi_Transcript_29249_1773 transcribed RNA sequence n=1 Tax=Wollemia nobilis TaxID=56998 RepID=A0A0C9S3G0_9CONI
MGSLAAAASSPLIAHLEVKVEEPELVVPAEPTEEGALFLSNIDQVVAYVVETVYFYPASGDGGEESGAEVVGKLKEALGKVLVPYHFMAGRMRLNPEKGRLEIDCNRAGALFAAASCDLTLCDLGDVSHPTPAFRSLVLQPSNAKKFGDTPLLMMQVTRFKCGGIVLGMSMNHSQFDGFGAMEFMMSFSSIARGQGLITHPLPDRTCLKARDVLQVKYEHLEGMKLCDLPEEIRNSFTTADVANADVCNFFLPPDHSYKVFPFTRDMLEKLKDKAMEDGRLKKCTTFDAIAALVWQARTKAIDMPSEMPSKILFAVDIRSKMNPPLPKGFAGNAVFSAYCIEPAGVVKEKPLSFCVEKVQEGVSRITDDYVKSSMDYCEIYKCIPALAGGFFLSAWWKIPFQLVDFGFGKPIYAGPIVNAMVEFVLLLSNGKQDGGLNLYIALQNDQLQKFEQIVYDF